MLTDVETVSDSFVAFLEEQSIGVFGDNIFISQVPDTATDGFYKINTSGGGIVLKLATGEKVKQYFVSISYHSQSAKDVERKTFRLEELLNCGDCVTLQGFEVYEISAEQFPTDDDVDDIERRIGFLQANIKIYKKEC